MYDDRVSYRLSAQGLALKRRRRANVKRANVGRLKTKKRRKKEKRDETERERNGGRAPF